MTDMNKTNVEALENAALNTIHYKDCVKVTGTGFVEGQEALNRFAPLSVEQLPILLGFAPKIGRIAGGLFEDARCVLEYKKGEFTYRFHRIENVYEFTVVDHGCAKAALVEAYILLNRDNVHAASTVLVKREGYFEAFEIAKTPAILCKDRHNGLYGLGADPEPYELRFKDTLYLVCLYSENTFYAIDEAKKEVFVHTYVWDKDKRDEVPAVKRYDLMKA